MSADVTIRESGDIRGLLGSDRGTWANDGAAKLGLTGV